MNPSLYPYLVLLVALAGLASVYVIYRIARKVISERRHTRAVKAASHSLDMLSKQILESEPQLTHAEASGTCKQCFADAKRSLVVLNQMKDFYYEQGAAIGEWNRLAARAQTQVSELQRAMCRAAEDGMWRRLAEDAINRADQHVREHGRPEGTEDNPCELTAARELMQRKEYQQAHQRANLLLPPDQRSNS